ncbi:MAG: hypothetical protein LC730_05615 [Acidobacteria bacterium]|nr:hypothetical protein [Acidobacteriota bacterium]MCA1608920.1 hypothetical protein [Acidobacteriota bacterium]
MLERVRKHWKDQDLSIEKPLDRSELDDRLNTLGIKATGEIVAVFSTLNGFKEVMDDELFAFWPIDQMIEENRKSEWVKDRN